MGSEYVTGSRSAPGGRASAGFLLNSTRARYAPIASLRLQETAPILTDDECPGIDGGSYDPAWRLNHAVVHPWHDDTNGYDYGLCRHCRTLVRATPGTMLGWSKTEYLIHEDPI